MLSSLIPPWVKIAAAAIVAAVIIFVIYQWRADIKQAAYDHIFKQQVTAQIQQQENRFRELLATEVTKREALEEQIKNQAKIEEDLKKLTEEFKARNFKNNPIDPGLQFTLEQILRAEQERKSAPIPLAPTKDGKTLENWKKETPK